MSYPFQYEYLLLNSVNSSMMRTLKSLSQYVGQENHILADLEYLKSAIFKLQVVVNNFAILTPQLSQIIPVPNAKAVSITKKSEQVPSIQALRRN